MARTTTQPRRGTRGVKPRRSRRLPILIAAGAGAVVVLAVGAWLQFGRAGDAGSQALFRFQTPDVHSLAFDLTDPATLYFGSHSGLLVSHDAGLHWQAGTLTGVDAMQQAIGLGSQERRYIAGHGAFYVSTDGGQTWQSQPNNLPSLDLHTFAGSPTDPNRLYAIPAGLGLWRSTDGGATWSEGTMPDGANTQPLALAVAPNEPNTLYLARNGQLATSTDAGRSWQSMPGPRGIISALTLAADAHETLYAGTLGGAYRRGANGAWERLPLTASGAIAALAASPAQPERLAAVDVNGRFYRSDDAGATWVTP